MMLPFSGLIRTTKGDRACLQLADRHYSRQKRGAKQFLPPGKTLVLRDAEGRVLFGWVHQGIRKDGQRGYYCAIFRNESERLSSDIIREAEQIVRDEWGPDRLFTYVDARRVQSANPGFCFKAAGWKHVGKSKERGKLLLEKTVS